MPEEESGIDPDINTNIDRDKWNDAQVLSQVAISNKGTDIPDALAVVNPDGTSTNESQGAYYLDETIYILTETYYLVNLGFKAKTIDIVNNGAGNRTIWISFDGINTHARITAGEDYTWNNIGVTKFYIRYSGDDAPDYKAFVY